jgi:hypothetical protein
VIDAWAKDAAGTRTTHAARSNDILRIRIEALLEAMTLV